MKSLLFSLLLSPALFAGSAAFLPDGKRVARQGDSGVLLLDLTTKVETALEFPDDFQVEFVGLSAGKDALILAGGQRVMSWNPATDTWTELWKAPDELTVDDVACNPKDGQVLVTTTKEDGEPEWWILDPKQPKKAGGVYNRRANHATSPVFDTDGNLYFTLNGDVWKGSIEAGDNEEVPYVLAGTRIWPLATLETSPANSSGTGAQTVLPLKDHLLVELSRIGGSGWGNIVRVPNADAFEKKLPLKWDELAECGSGCGAALSPDGKKAMIHINGEGWFEVNPANGDLKKFAGSAAKDDE
ncbi:hypothetical protein OKA04_04425 [Luteolibacter flavescens]|uniref:Uncharacterized protein n=1 Tax=Luteolibacter flavescens TaxID=1859460 RepID=A0ABT3FK62_9BACT|nr:hypothetical protein [Luteolibacter flavescens]MCW1883961.1 hypothetical protein [Luteolibacter flavescens]